MSINNVIVTGFEELEKQGEQKRKRDQQIAMQVLTQQLQGQAERERERLIRRGKLQQYLARQTDMPLHRIKEGMDSSEDQVYVNDISKRLKLIRDQQDRQRKARKDQLQDMMYQSQNQNYARLNQNLAQIVQNTRKKENIRRQRLQRAMNLMREGNIEIPQQQVGQYKFEQVRVPANFSQKQQQDYRQKIAKLQSTFTSSPRQALLNKNRIGDIIARDPRNGDQTFLQDIPLRTRPRQQKVMNNTNNITAEINENVKEFINENKDKVQRAFKFEQLLNQQIKMDEQQTIEDFKQYPSKYFDFLFNPKYYGKTTKIQFLNLVESIGERFGKSLTDENLNEKFKNAVIKQVKYPTGGIAKHIQFLKNLIQGGNRNAIVRLKKVRQMLNFKQWGGFIFDLSKIMTYPYELINGVRQLRTTKTPQLGFQIDNGQLKLYFNGNNKTRPVNALQFNHNFLKNILKMRNRVMNNGIKSQYAIAQKDKDLKNAFEAKYLS